MEWDRERSVYTRVDIPDYSLPFGAQRRFLTLTRDTVRKFCQSADPALSAAHLPYLGELEPELRPLVGGALLDRAQALWAELSSPQGRLKTDHDHYLKCQPFGTQVRVVTLDRSAAGGIAYGHVDRAIEDIQVGDRVVSWGGARYGRIRSRSRVVTRVGRREYSGELVTVSTSTHSSRYTHDHITIARLSSGLDSRHCVYLMRKGTSFRVGRVAWKYGSQGGTHGLNTRIRSQDPDAVWVLSMCRDEPSAALAEALYSHRFGIPTWQFQSRNERMPLSDFWSAVGDLTSAAKAVLESCGRDLLYPLWERGESFLVQNRGALEIRACNLMDGMLVCVADGAVAYTGKRGSVERVTGSWSDAWRPVTVSRERWSGTVCSLEVDTDHTYVADGIVTHNCWALTNPQIGSPGDVLLYDEAQDANGALAGVVLSQRGRVQLVLCGDPFQELYSFTGSIDAMQNFSVQPGVRTLPLRESRRFGPDIAAHANGVLNLLDPDSSVPMRLVGIGPDGGQLRDTFTHAETLAVDAVVCATNRQVVDAIVEHTRAGRRVYSTLDLQDLVALAHDVALVEAGQASECSEPMLRRFTDLVSWREWLKSDPSVEEEAMHAQVALVRTYGAVALEQLARTVVTSRDVADVTVSTIHKAKGGTWEQVLVKMGEVDVEDTAKLRMLYVAMTRARTLVLREVTFVTTDETGQTRPAA